MNQHISSSASIGNDVQIGYNVVIMDNVQIGSNCTIANNVIIYPNSRIGSHVRIDDNCIIGKMPLSSPRSIFKPPVELREAVIGDFCQIGANVIIYAQCTIGEKNLIADLATIRENVAIGSLISWAGEYASKTSSRLVTVTNLRQIAILQPIPRSRTNCFVAPCVATSNDNYMARDKERFNHFKGVTTTGRQDRS